MKEGSEQGKLGGAGSYGDVSHILELHPAQNLEG